MSFRKPYHMPFRKLVPPLTLTVLTSMMVFCARANYASTTIGKRFLVENSTSLLYLPISSSDETWKSFKNMPCQFCSLKLTF